MYSSSHIADQIPRLIEIKYFTEFTELTNGGGGLLFRIMSSSASPPFTSLPLMQCFQKPVVYM